jgi:hypothetical protein
MKTNNKSHTSFRTSNSQQTGKRIDGKNRIASTNALTADSDAAIHQLGASSQRTQHRRRITAVHNSGPQQGSKTGGCMKNPIALTLASLLLGVLPLGALAQAQSAERIIKANIPFEFSVGERVFPAGSYSLISTAPVFLDLRDANGRIVVRVLTNSVETRQVPASPVLEFYNEGGRHSLAQVWQENQSIGQELPQSKSWAKIAKRHIGHTQTIVATNSR